MTRRSAWFAAFSDETNRKERRRRLRQHRHRPDARLPVVQGDDGTTVTATESCPCGASRTLTARRTDGGSVRTFGPWT